MYRFYVLKIKNYILPTIFFLFTISLLLFSSSNLTASKNGLILWANSVVPSLFPFFVATELLSKTNIPFFLGKVFNPLMKPLFNISGEGSFGLIMGIISGYPTGAKIAVNFRNDNILSKEECERLLSFTNNSGPLFIIGTIGISMFGSTQIGILLLVTHIISALTVGIIFRKWKYSNIKNNIKSNKKDISNSISFSSLGEILSEAISNSISIILMIGGFIVLFSVIISILKQSNFLFLITNLFEPILLKFNIPKEFVSSIFIGLLEITNGISLISIIKIKQISLNLIITAFILGTGGVSVFLQVFSIVSKSDLSIKPYILGKLLHGIIAGFYTYVFIEFIPFFNFNL